MGAPETAATAGALADALREAAEFPAKREAMEAEVRQLEQRASDLVAAKAEYEADLQRRFDEGEETFRSRMKDLADRLAVSTVKTEAEIAKQEARVTQITADAVAAQRAADDALEARRQAAIEERLKWSVEFRAAQTAASDAQCAAQVALSALEEQRVDLQGRIEAARTELKEIIERAQRLLSAAG